MYTQGKKIPLGRPFLKALYELPGGDISESFAVSSQFCSKN